MRYLVIAGNPYSMYTGTTTFMSLSLLGCFNAKESAERCLTENYEKHAGLINIIDTEERKLLSEP